jgi:hypothetical protein
LVDVQINAPFLSLPVEFKSHGKNVHKMHPSSGDGVRIDPKEVLGRC